MLFQLFLALGEVMDQPVAEHSHSIYSVIEISEFAIKEISHMNAILAACREQYGDLIQRKSQFLGLLYEFDAVDRVFRKSAISAMGSGCPL